jgi:hypothetical protein
VIGIRREEDNKLVSEPSKATENEKFPVISTHADILDGFVDNFALHLKHQSSACTFGKKQGFTVLAHPIYWNQLTR